MTDPVELRRSILARRSALAAEEHRHLSQLICQAVMQEACWQRAQRVLFFLPFRQEVNIEPLLQIAWQSGKEVYAPRCLPEKRYLKISRLRSMAQLEAGSWGIREPLATLPEADPTLLDAVLVPGAVFDKQGGRLGYGGGYYDRFLLRCRDTAWRIAPHFSFQLLDDLPQEEHDQKMHLLINEKESLYVSYI